MEPERVWKVLSRAEDSLLQQLAAAVLREAPEITVVKEPRVGLVMMRARESVEGRVFNLGEVMVSECMVALGDVAGWGCCLGEDLSRAHRLAVIDLALRVPLRSAPLILAALQEEEARIKHEEKCLFAAVARSRVDFEVM